MSEHKNKEAISFSEIRLLFYATRQKRLDPKTSEEERNELLRKEKILWREMKAREMRKMLKSVCNVCRNSLSTSARFCSKCGNSIESLGR